MSGGHLSGIVCKQNSKTLPGKRGENKSPELSVEGVGFIVRKVSVLVRPRSSVRHWAHCL